MLELENVGEFGGAGMHELVEMWQCGYIAARRPRGSIPSCFCWIKGVQEFQRTADRNAGTLELDSRYLYMCENGKMGEVKLKILRESRAGECGCWKSATSWVDKMFIMQEFKSREPMRKDTDARWTTKRDST